MSIRRFGRKVKSLAQKGSPRAFNKHIIKTEKVGTKERMLHATKGWRERVA